MQTGPKMVLGSLAVLILVGGAEYGYRSYENKQANKPVEREVAKSDPDDLVFIKQEHPSTLADEKALKGKTIWIQAGGQLTYFPYNGHTADLHKSLGMLLGAEPLQIQDAVEQVAPADEQSTVQHGDKQVLLVFRKPGNPQEYAAPVGFRQGSDYTFYSDLLFFYEDPHQLYAAWGPQVWSAIDAHKAIPGMTEHQANTALGLGSPSGDNPGDRTISYMNGGHPVTVTFAGGKATRIEDAKQ